MNLFIPKPASHSNQLIAVASERLTKNVYEYDFLEDKDGVKYKIIEHFEFSKEQRFPGGLMLLATGQEVESEIVWKAYPRSDKLYFFIVKKQ